jgi:hypothetical protein
MQRTKSVELVVLPSECKYHHVKIEHVWQLEWQILRAVNINSKETPFSKKSRETTTKILFGSPVYVSIFKISTFGQE